MYLHQGWHLILIVLLLTVASVVFSHTPAMQSGSLLGLTVGFWFYTSLLMAILHQVYVWFCWRAELLYKTLSTKFGRKAFRYYTILFSILFLLRPVLVWTVGISNRNSLQLQNDVLIAIVIFLAVPFLYTMWSVKKYFDFNRAFGADHFFDEVRKLPFVRKGAFRITSNAMYVFGFFILWIIALLCRSQAALLSAAFQHLYIWVHYYCTEKPDIAKIYGDKT